MEKEEILRSVAPCGLVCYTCGGCDYGVLKEHSKQLLHYLEGITGFLDGEDKEKIERGYPMLELFAGFDCPGCRSEAHQCKIKNCTYRECTISKNINFCAECDDFPCDKEEYIHCWRSANTRIREVGIEQFFDEEKEKPHYLWCKDS